MAHALMHAKADALKFGGQPSDYLAINEWFDATKAHLADARHRMLLHNSFGIFLCEQVFGRSIINSDGKEIPVRLIAENHVLADFGFIPSVEQCLDGLPLQRWMFQGAAALSRDPKVNVKRITPAGREVVTPEEYARHEARHHAQEATS